MKRYRMTLLAISLILLYLGFADLRLVLNNTEVQDIELIDLVSGADHQEVMHIKGGYMDLKHAISTSGSIELEALLVPLTLNPGEQPFKVFVETRAPEVLTIVNKYNFDMDTDFEREQFYKENKSKFYPQRNITGMTFSSLVANQNQVKLVKLVKNVGLDVDENILFVAEGKTPPKVRGIFFLVIGILGGIKSFSMFKKAREEQSA